MKILVTHLYPHLDDVAGFWLLKRFDPALKNAKMKFVATKAKGVKLAPNEIGVGVGRGKFDEHKGDRNDSSTSLIWKDLKRRRLLPGGLEGQALADLADYVRRGDLGQFIGQPGNFFNESAILQLIAGLKDEDSRSATEIGFRMLDARYVMHQGRAAISEAIRRGKRFTTKWGRGLGITTDAIPQMVSSLTAEHKYAIVVLTHPKGKYLHVRANPHGRADLTRLAREVMSREDDGEWFFHQSKKMLIHGDRVAPTEKRTKIGVAEMIRLIRKHCA